MDEMDDPNFDIQLTSVEPSQELKYLTIEEKFDKYRRGNYSALEFVIKIRRKLSYHMVQTYLPSVLLLFITWLCFLLPSDMVEARIGKRKYIILVWNFFMPPAVIHFENFLRK